MAQDKCVTSIEELTIPDSINPPSHTLYPIGGIPVHVYGIDEATKSLEKSPSSELVVFNLVHPRTRTYEYAQRLAYLILDAYYKARLQNGADLPPAVAATFDLRNHGHRIIADGNSDWREGNATHGQDMVTGIMGTVQDVELVLEFLPAYLPSVLTTSENASLKRFGTLFLVFLRVAILPGKSLLMPMLMCRKKKLEPIGSRSVHWMS